MSKNIKYMESNMMENQVTPETGDEKSTGSIVGIIIIVIVLILGGFYFWGQKIDKEATIDEETPVGEVVDLEQDLNNLNTGDIDAEMENIDAELGL